MKFDFENDLKEWLKNELQIENKNAEDLILLFFNKLRKNIPNRKRKVLKSNEFICPEQKTTELEAFIQDIENGHDINPYLSTNINQSQKLDNLLNSWGIHHFHFDKCTSKLKNRSNELIFGKVIQDAIFFINIYKHNSWHDTEILEIINRNWPALVQS